MRAVFLDRDGVINEYPGDFQYVKSWKEFQFLPRSKAALKRLTDNNIALFIASNQAGVSKNIYSKSELDLITQNMLKELKSENIRIEDVFYCIHIEEDKCNCRKPKTGLVEQGLSKLKSLGEPVDLNKSYFVGDSIRDVETGKAAGLKTILVLSGREKLKNMANWKIQPDFVCADLSEATDIILKK